jgi:hypothetical protein
MTKIWYKPINFSDESINHPNDVLACPHCNSSSLRQCGGVTIYERKDDDPEVVQVHVENGVATTLKIPNEVSRNPSEHGNGLAIRFWCMACRYNWN